jgi:sulfate adenylyltransferase
MIKPHGSDQLKPLYVMDANKRRDLEKEALGLPSIIISSAAAANAVMLGSGYFTPLTGYMNLKDTLAVAENMHTGSGLFWPVPIVNILKDTSTIDNAKRIALRDPNVEGNPVLAIQEIETIANSLDRGKGFSYH